MKSKQTLSLALAVVIAGGASLSLPGEVFGKTYDSETVIWSDMPLEDGFWEMDPNLDRKETYYDKNGNTVINPYKSEGDDSIFINSEYYEYLWTKGLPIGNGRLGAMVMGAIDKEVIQVNEDTVWTGSPYVDKDGNLTGGSRKDGWKVYRGENEDGTPADIGTKENTVSYESLHIDNTPDLSFDKNDKESIKEFEEKAKEAVEYRKNLDTYVESSFLGEPVKQKAYQSFVEAFLDFGQDSKKAENFSKSLDMEQAVATVEYDYNNVHYTRESFASYPDQVVATKVTADKKNCLSFSAELHTFHNDENCAPAWRKISDNEIALTAKVKDGTKEGEVGNESKIKFEARLIVRSSDGKISVSPDAKKIYVTNGSDAEIYIVGASNYVNFKTLDDSKPEKDCNTYSANVLSKTYDEMRAAHIADYKALFDRTSLTVENNSNTAFGEIPTAERNRITLPDGTNGYNLFDSDERLKSTFSEGDNSLAVLAFNFGKYLIIEGSREGSQPLNLQGVWNSTNSPSWNGKFTININTEMNYWAENILDLSECEKPLLESIKELAESGYITAKEQYGITDSDGVYDPGDAWVMHHNFDLWKGTQPIDNATAGVWPVGGAWLLDHVWEYYSFNNDKEYLNEFYPLIKGACRFFTQFLVVDEKTGYLITAASVSPEHGGIQPGPAMDTQLIRNLYDITLKARDIIGDNTDNELFDKMEEQLGIKGNGPVIAPDIIDEGGFISEWTRGDVSYDLQKNKSEDVPSWTLNEYERNPDGSFATDEKGNKIVKEQYDMKYHGAVNNDSHKHCSHLWELYPGRAVSPFDSDTTLFNAYKKTAIAKETAGQGWGLAWRTNLRARCLDGEGAYQMVEQLLTTRMSPDMFDQHPNFQIDGNYGLTAGIAEMLLQSHDGGITLLPALPAEWSRGEYKGFKARGGYGVSVNWENSKVKTAKITSENGGSLTLRAKGLSSMTITDSKGNIITAQNLGTTEGFDIITFDTVKGETYTLSGH